MFLQRVVRFSRGWLRSEKEIVPNHWPNSGNVTALKQHLFVVATEDLVHQINEATADINPHECQVPLQRTSEPTTYGERFWPVDQNFLRYFCPETWKCTKNLKPASNHHKQSHRVHPMAKAHEERMFVDG